MSGRSQNKKRGGNFSALLLKLVGGTLFVLSVVVTLSHHGLPPHATEMGASFATSAASSSGTSALQGSTGGIPVDPAVLYLIRIQNETIMALRRQLETVTRAKLSGSGSSGNSMASSRGFDDHGETSHSLMATQLASAQAEVATLRSQISLLPPAPSSSNRNSNSNSIGGSFSQPLLLPNLLRTGMDEECEARFGLGLSDMIR